LLPTLDASPLVVTVIPGRISHGWLLERFARVLYPRVEAIAKTLPGGLRRIFGAE
jgi:hypothetical protein